MLEVGVYYRLQLLNWGRVLYKLRYFPARPHGLPRVLHDLPHVQYLRRFLKKFFINLNFVRKIFCGFFLFLRTFIFRTKFFILTFIFSFTQSFTHWNCCQVSI